MANCEPQIKAIPQSIRAIIQIKKNCLAGRRVIVQTIALTGFLSFKGWGLPLPRQKNLLKLAFSVPESPKGTLIQMSKICLYTITNQWYVQVACEVNSRFLSFKTVVTDFEFNKPILKKRGWILKDFEKNHPDFERFRMDFERNYPKPHLPYFQFPATSDFAALIFSNKWSICRHLRVGQKI